MDYIGDVIVLMVAEDASLRLLQIADKLFAPPPGS
jgi:hypothetical protein